MARFTGERSIECDGYYVPGEKCLGHRFTEPYREDQCIRTGLGCPKIERRLARHDKKRKVESKQRVNGTVYKQCVADLKKVTIVKDFDASILPLEPKDGWTINKRLEQVEYTVAGIRERNWHWHIDDFGRFHTNVTNLNNLVTPSLRLDGEPLASVDISNSQPLFLAYLLAQSVGQAGTGRHGIAQGVGGATTMMSGMTHRHTASAVNEEFKRQIQEFQKLAESGELYDAIAEACGLTRKEAKHQFFVYAYGGAWWKGPCSDWFEDRFSLIAAKIHDIKIQCGRKKPDCLACKLQTTESQFVFGELVPRYRQASGARLLTKHDSLLVPISEVAVTEKVFRDAFGAYGIRGNWKVEVYE